MSNGLYYFHMFAAAMELFFIIGLLWKIKGAEKIGLVIHMICSAVYIFSFAELSRATTFSEAAFEIKMEYAASIFIVISVFLMIGEYFDLKIAPGVYAASLVINFVVLFGVMTFEHHQLFYSTIQITEQNGYLVLHKGHGILYYVNVANIIFTDSFCFGYIVAYFKKRKEALTLECFSLSFIVLIPLLSFIVYLLGWTRDILSITIFVGDILFVILTLQHKLFDVTRYSRLAIVENMDDAIIVLDDKDYVLEFNQKAVSIFGTALEKGIKVNTEQFFSGDVTQREYHFNGKIYEITKNPIEFHKQVRGYLYILVDITESRKQVAESLALKEKAEAANQAKTNFLAHMSHEIRTPINAIVGMNQMILEESSDQQINQYAQNIDVASATLLALVNDVLDFSKIEAGKMTLVNKPYHLKEMLQNITNLIYLRAEKKKLKLDLKISPLLPTEIIGDEIRIRQILINILDNAVKYTTYGTITGEASVEEMTGDDVVIRYQIRDTGRGIREEDMKAMFDPFSRLDEQKNVNQNGTGLGMSIIKQLLHQMGSELKVESIYGEGSTFSFLLKQQIVDPTPIGEFTQAIEENDVQKKPAAWIAPNAKVLVVDDSKMNCDVISGLMKTTKINITVCYDGISALSYTEFEQYDLIFMDQMMPILDGVETFHKIREQADGLNKDTPVVALTANAISGAREELLKEGFNDYLAKPVVKRQLLQMLEKWLSKERMQENTQTNVIDEHKAMELCDGEKELFEVLKKSFVEEWEEKEELLQEAYEKQDWQEYIILVHGLKNNAINIGATTLSECAKSMEFAGKEERYGDIYETQATLIKMLEEILAICREGNKQEG